MAAQALVSLSVFTRLDHSSRPQLLTQRVTTVAVQYAGFGCDVRPTLSFSVMSVTSALPRAQAIARILELTAHPEVTGTRPWLVVTVGLPGSGKSTFARRLARATGAAVLESDGLRRALFPRASHGAAESKQLFDALYGAASRLLEDGVSVVVDATNLRERDRVRAYEVAEGVGVPVLLIHFRAPERVIAERLSKRGAGADPEDSSTAGLSVYMMLAETEEPVTREHWKIDTSDVDATEAALQRAIETLTTQPRPAVGRHTGGSNS